MRREENKYNDCISRQAVLELLQNEYIEMSITDAWRKEVTFAEINVNALKELPSIMPVSIKGHWVDVPKYYGILFECDVCNHYQGTIKYSYCPNCGAEMEV